MGTKRCPNCNSEVKIPSRIIGFIFGALAMVFVGVPMFLVACVAAIAAIGANATEDFSDISEQVDRTMKIQAESTEMLDDVF